MADYTITEYLYRIKENIQAIACGQREQFLLDEIESDFYQLLERIKLFLISERDSYYGYFMMNLSFHANFYSKSIAGIKLNTYPPVMESNPLLLCSYSLKEIIFIICHEIEHILLNHPAEMVKCNPTGEADVFEKFNLAADASVNDRLRYEVKTEKRTFMMIPEWCILSETLKKMFRFRSVRPMENYYYYFQLMMNRDKSHEGETSDPDDGSSGSVSSEGEMITPDNCGTYDDHNWEAGDDADEITAVIRTFVNTATEMMDKETRGLMPAYYLEQVQKINEPPRISWKKLLKKYIGTIPDGKKKTQTRLNRRQPERYDLSGTVCDKILKIVVAVDTSVSVTDRDISMIFNEIFSILSRRKYCMTVIECDSEIQRVYTVKKPDDVKPDIAGRGGTAFTPVIEYINADRYFRDALLIYFTDGFGEDRIPKPLTYRNLWVITDVKNQLSLEEPYGAVIALEEEY